ncbi:MAG: hypothetical protein AMJ69_00915 [Gammaproteobacteria bacterium SG8_47]|nr:MAG: hypothetical protein AMJ69_00915 [Gammaproteobacteria bacterium SG8_47]
MRYEQGTTPHELGAPVGEGTLLGTAVLGLFIGIGFVIAGRRGRQLWMTAWGAGLVVASVIYLGAAAVGLT